MSLTGIKTLPILAGSLATVGPWASLFARPDHRVYPYDLGAGIRADSSGTTLSLYGKGALAVNDYVVVCSAVDYGGAPYFVPDLTRIRRVTAVSASDDQVTVGSAVSVVTGEYLLNLEADTAAVPLTSPSYDGSDITLYDDQAGVGTNSNKYLVTSQGGTYRGWVESGSLVVDLLITNGSGVPVLVIPLVPVGPEVVV